jgi:hypothetical protein
MTDAEDRSRADHEEEIRRLSPEDVEARLQQRLADAEQERERMLGALVPFYLKTCRLAQAVPCVRRLLATTMAPEDQAPRLLMLGQLLEQTDDLPGRRGSLHRGPGPGGGGGGRALCKGVLELRDELGLGGEHPLDRRRRQPAWKRRVAREDLFRRRR